MSLVEPMWRFYPKQVQNILKKKRIDRDRLKRSLKPPGKRNYKVLFSNIKRVSEEEVSRASSMFKEMKDVYYKLVNAEKKVYKALQEKGLFLDQHDFNIMEVFNCGMSEYSSDQENESVIRDRMKESQIFVDEFESTSAKDKGERAERQALIVTEPRELNFDIPEKVKINSSLDLSSVGQNGTPNSHNSFGRFSHISRNTYRSHNSYSSKSSHRLLFPEYQTERRPQHEHSHQQKGDFL